ncbi:MAG: twin-arginine translocase TatA/TatE family subunit [Paludibacteraceae bacterium]|nr:twin-arginine translocase TatA/TatE family subunit [Paludibacteraceae bacterium]
MIGAPEIVCIVLIVLLLFGGKKIPELMRGLGKGVKSFKEGMNDIEEDIKRPVNDAQPTDKQSDQDGE